MQIREILEQKGSSLTSLGSTRSGSGPRLAFGRLGPTLKNITQNIVKNSAKNSLNIVHKVGDLAKNIIIFAAKDTRSIPQSMLKGISNTASKYPTGHISKADKAALPKLQKYQNADGTLNHRQLRSEEWKAARHVKLKEIQGKPLKRFAAIINKYTLGQNTYGWYYLYAFKPALLCLNVNIFLYTIKEFRKEAGNWSFIALVSALIQIPYDLFMSKGKLLFDAIMLADFGKQALDEMILGFLETYNKTAEIDEILKTEDALNQAADQIEQKLAAQVNNSYTETMQQLNKIEKSVNYCHNNPQDVDAALAYVKENYPDLPEAYEEELAIKMLEDCAHPEPILAGIEELRSIMEEAIV